MKTKAVIFDRDGVILDSESVNIASAVRAFQILGIEIQESEKKEIVGRNPEDYKTYFLDKYSFAYDKFRKIQKEISYELLESTPLFKKTVSLIKKLHTCKIPIALTTSAGIKSTLCVLKKADLENVFNAIVTSEDCQNRKPHPEPYIITAEKLNMNPENCVVIEDTSVGLESAKNAGMKCIVIPNDITKNQDFSRADLVVASADEIDIELLNNI